MHFEPSQSDPPPVYATAKFDFNGKNNDELSFLKNDVLTVTQQLDGGWWEATLDGQTGWFPSNYVTITSDRDKLMRSRSVPNANLLANGVSSGQGTPVPSDGSHTISLQQFRDEVLKEMEASEVSYLGRLNEIHNSYLIPIENSTKLNSDDFSTLQFNLPEILSLQTETLSLVQEQLKLPMAQQRVGGVLLQSAAELKRLLLDYCWNHPKAVEVMNEKDSELRAVLSGVGKEMKGLITGLSEPFRHLDKYPSVLQELERSVQEGHVDRGDVQRSCAVYKDIRALCEAARKQKETQLELLYTEQVEKWASFEERGRIRYVGTGSVRSPEGEQNDRCIAVFSKLVLILEITTQLNSYELVKKIPTTGLIVKKVEGGICFSGADSFTLLLSSSFESDRWLENLAKTEGVRVEESTAAPLTRPPTPQKFSVQNINSLSPVCTPEMTRLPVASRARVGKKASFGSGDLKLNHELEMILPEGIDDSLNSGAGSRRSLEPRAENFTIRPTYQNRAQNFGPDGAKKNIKMRKEVPVSDVDDSILLRIIEGYCSGAARTVPPSVDRPPQLIVAEDEKILIEEKVGDEIILQEKSLVDTVYSLKDQLSNMRQEFTELQRTVEREQKARRRLEDLLRRQGGLQTNITSPTPASPSS